MLYQGNRSGASGLRNSYQGAAKVREEEFVRDQESQLSNYLFICLFIYYHLTSVEEFIVCVKT